MPINKNISDFAVGIDRLIPDHDEPPTRLPESGPLAPTGRPVKINVDTLRGPLSIQEDALLCLLKPTISNAFVLSPARYQSLLDEARITLAKLASGGHLNAAKLAAGARLIEAEQQLTQLLSTQRQRFLGA